MGQWDVGGGCQSRSDMGSKVGQTGDGCQSRSDIGMGAKVGQT